MGVRLSEALKACGQSVGQIGPTATFRIPLPLLPAAHPSSLIDRRAAGRGLALGFGVWGLGCGVWGLGFGVWGQAVARSRFSFSLLVCAHAPRATDRQGLSAWPTATFRIPLPHRPAVRAPVPRTYRCHARLAQGLCCRSVHKLPRSADTNAAVGLERQEVLVTRDDDVGLRRQRRRCARTGRSSPGAGRRGRCDR